MPIFLLFFEYLGGCWVVYLLFSSNDILWSTTDKVLFCCFCSLLS